jgi:hypothetical protein
MRLESLDILNSVDSNDEDSNKTTKYLNKNLTLIEKDDSTIVNSNLDSISPLESVSFSLAATNSTTLSIDHDIIKHKHLKNNINVIEFKHKEGGWGWVVLLCVIWSYGLAVSWYTNFNLIIPHFINYYNQTEHYTVFYAG